MTADRLEGPANVTTPGTVPARMPTEVYARAEQFLPWNAKRLIAGLQVTPQWDDDGRRFWYRLETPSGHAFVLVDPERQRRVPAFDHVRLAAALSRASGIPVTHDQLPFERFEYEDDAAIGFQAYGQQWRCDLGGYACEARGEVPDGEEESSLSPDGQWAAFVQDHNLCLRSTQTGDVVALTDDGTAGFDYASPLPSPLKGAGIEGRAQPPALGVLWSPGSHSLLSCRIASRDAGQFHLVQSVPLDGSLRPALHSYVYPLPGDPNVPRAQLIVVDVETKTVRTVDGLEIPMLYYGSPLRPDWVWWSEDSRRIVLVTRGRGYQSYRLSVIDPATGALETLLEETAATAIDPHPTHSGRPLIRILSDGSILWFSQRDGWGHLCRYDPERNEPPRQITSGPWLVTDVLHLDEEQRQIYLTGMGREPGKDPYFNYLYRVGIDGGEPELLTPEDATHQISFSPAGGYFVDSYSRVDLSPTTVVRGRGGELLLELEQADIGRLEATGWKPPERFRVKARDGVTDIYGVLILPSHFDPASGASLPVLDSIYAGPQTNQAPTSFVGYSSTLSVPGKTRDFWQAQALAELGFAVVMIDGLGMPFRDKAFHDRSFRQLGDGGIEDHVVAIRELAERYRFLDLDRVGIYGHSAGGYASTRAMLMFPDFYKVAVSTAGNHDHRLDKTTWVERYMGLPVDEHYHEQSNVTQAHRLMGKLLLMHGEMDENVHPASTLQVVDALIKANKDFDLLILPNRPHGMVGDPYFVRRRWDYFVRHLRGQEPPADYAIAPETA